MTMARSVGAAFALVGAFGATTSDPRFIPNGAVIAGIDTGYSDQPMCVVSRGGSLACTTTVTGNHEGGSGEHIAASVSEDFGATWAASTKLEAESSLTNAYNALFQSPKTGRLVALYGMNDDNVTTSPSGETLRRTDILGYFRVRSSDDGGRTWSAGHSRVPLRPTRIDETNVPFEGNVTMQWVVDKGIVTDGGDGVLVAFTKVGTFVSSPPEEVFLLHSPDLFAVGDDLGKAEWRTVGAGPSGPTAPRGLRSWSDDAPGVSAEPHVVPTPKGFYLVFRTDAGFVGAASAPAADGPWALVDGTWASHRPDPAFPARNASYPLKNPRGPITPRLFETVRGAANGTYLMLYYNNGGEPTGTIMGFPSRCVYWIVPGWAEDDGQVLWGEPEVALYESHDTCKTHNGPGYPDFIETEDAVYISETNKAAAYVHKVDASLLALLFSQHDRATYVDGFAAGLLLDIPFEIPEQRLNPSNVSAVALPDLSELTAAGLPRGLTLEMQVQVQGGPPKIGERLVDTRLEAGGAGVAVSVAAAGLEFTVSDGAGTASLATTSDCAAAMEEDGVHQIAFVVDAGPSIVTALVDGRLCDGGDATPTYATKGWEQYQPTILGRVDGGGQVQIGPDYSGVIRSLRVYATALTHTEVIGNQRADRARRP